MLGVYFHKKDISVAALMFFDSFTTNINVEKAQKGVYKNPYLSFKIIRADHNVMFEDTKRFILELLAYADANLM